MYSESFRAMNSDILLMAASEEARAQAGFRAARDFIEASERRFTRFSEDSELAALNRSAGEWFQASKPLFTVVKEALACYERTSGLFDPSVLPYLKQAGYTRSMDELRREGAQPATLQNRSLSSFARVELDEGRSAIRLPGDMQIDLGGIAKGWIAEQAALLLRQFTDAGAVSAGGDIYMSGYPEDQDYWEVALEDPRDPSADAAILRVQEGAIATSSITKRVWKQGEATRHHLIDPRTGEPAVTSWLSVTAIAGHAAEAETFAKAFLIAGESERSTLAEKNPELVVLAVNRDGELVELAGART